MANWLSEVHSLQQLHAARDAFLLQTMDSPVQKWFLGQEYTFPRSTDADKQNWNSVCERQDTLDFVEHESLTAEDSYSQKYQ